MKALSSRVDARLVGISVLAFVVLISARVNAADPKEASPQGLPLLRIRDFQYEGAFRLPARKYGKSELNFSQGPIAFNPDKKSLFIMRENPRLCRGTGRV